MKILPGLVVGSLAVDSSLWTPRNCSNQGYEERPSNWRTSGRKYGMKMIKLKLTTFKPKFLMFSNNVILDSLFSHISSPAIY